MTFTHLSYKFKLEQSPDGVWAATSEDPPCKLEGATREEVEQKMKEKIGERLAPDIAQQIKFAIPGVKVNSNIKVTLRRGDSGSVAQDADGPKAEAVLSPKLLVLIGALIAIVLLVWRLTAHS